MMPPVCALPGLIWPSAGASEALKGIELPGLAALLGRAVIHQSPAVSLDSWLAAQFGLSGEPPIAALRLVGEERFLSNAPTSNTQTTTWICADPVALNFSRQHLLLSDPETLEITEDEARAMVGDLNQAFSDLGDFYAATPTRWYLRVKPGVEVGVKLHPLADVIGRPISYFQPEGENQRFWAQVGNELQVFCHNHPINLKREAGGKLPLNALWLWGNGTLPSTPLRSPANGVAGRSPVLAGLAKLAGADSYTSVDPLVANWMLISDLIEPARQRDLPAWIEALRRIDRDILIPLAQALKRGSFKALKLIAPCDQTLLMLDATHRPRWQIWQRDASMFAVVSLLAGEPKESN